MQFISMEVHPPSRFLPRQQDAARLLSIKYSLLTEHIDIVDMQFS